MKQLMKRLLPGLLILSLLLAVLPFGIAGADNGGVVVSLDVPAEAEYCTNITARVNIVNVTNMDTYQFQVTYNTSILEVIGAEGGAEGVTNGLVGPTAVTVDMWSYAPNGTPGTMFILGNVPGLAGASGDGYLCDIHFHVIGSACQTSNITFSSGFVWDNGNPPVEITVTAWLGGSVHVFETFDVFDCEADANPTKVGHNTTFSVNVTGGYPPYILYYWDFGDGNYWYSMASSPTYAYAEAGTYTVNVTVTDSHEQQGSCEFDITVEEALSVTCGVDPARTNVDEDVDFSCTPDGGVLPYSYSWDFGDGETSSSQNPTHRYSRIGDYTACVTVEDYLGNIEDCCVDVGIIAAGVDPECDVETGPARFAASYLRVSPEQVVPNEQVEISINIGNKGGERGSRTVALYINGYLEESQTVGVGAGSSRAVVFRVTKSEPGTYVVIVEGQEGRFFVLAPQKTTFLGDGGLGTGGIIVIVVVAIAIILAIVFVFRRRE